MNKTEKNLLKKTPNNKQAKNILLWAQIFRVRLWQQGTDSDWLSDCIKCDKFALNSGTDMLKQTV